MNSSILPLPGLLAMTCASVLLAAGCSTTGGHPSGDRTNAEVDRRIHVRSTTSLEKNLVATNAALRVGIELPDRVEQSGALSVEQHVLRTQLHKAMDDSQHWASVRLAPRSAAANFDVWVVLTLEQSNGLVFTARLQAADALGVCWRDETYTFETGEHDVAPGKLTEVYHPAFAQMANDLARFLDKLAPDAHARIREVRTVRYAAGFSPKYKDHLVNGPDSLPAVAFKPAEGDSTWTVIQRIQAEEDAYLEQVTKLLESHRFKVTPAYQDYLRAARASVKQAQACQDARAKIEARKQEIEEKTKYIQNGNILYQVSKFIMDIFDVKMNRPAVREIERIIQDLVRENEKDQAKLPQLDKQLAYENKQLETVKSEFFQLSQSLGNEARNVSVWLNGELVELSGSVAEQHNLLRQVFNKRYMLENKAPEVALPGANP